MNEKNAIDLINKAFYKLAEAHEMLRIEYDPVTNKLFCREICEQDKEIIEHFIINESEYEKQIECMRSAALGIREKISIENGIAIRGGLFELSSGDEYLFITIHHLAVDGVSWRIILDDLSALLTDNDVDSVIIGGTDSFIEWANVIMEKGMWAFDDEKEMWTSIIRKGTDNETEPRKITYTFHAFHMLERDPALPLFPFLRYSFDRFSYSTVYTYLERMSRNIQKERAENRPFFV